MQVTWWPSHFRCYIYCTDTMFWANSVNLLFMRHKKLSCSILSANILDMLMYVVPQLKCPFLQQHPLVVLSLFLTSDPVLCNFVQDKPSFYTYKPIKTTAKSIETAVKGDLHFFFIWLALSYIVTNCYLPLKVALELTGELLQACGQKGCEWEHYSRSVEDYLEGLEEPREWHCWYHCVALRLQNKANKSDWIILHYNATLAWV